MSKKKKKHKVFGKVKSLKQAYTGLKKQFGTENIKMLGKEEMVDIPAISSGCFYLDRAFGTFGFPCGRITEIFGPESSGKTTLALHAMANAQKAGGIAAMVDAEHAFDPVYARKVGVKVEDLIISQPDYGEKALEIVGALVDMGVKIVVIDSVAALVPKAEIDGNMGDSHMGLHARLMSQAMRKLNGRAKKTGTTLIFINQTRVKIGVMFGSNKTTTGGNALKFYAAIRVDLFKKETITKKDKKVAIKVQAYIVKNKVAPPFHTALFEIYFSRGINNIKSMAECGVYDKVITKKGSYYSFGGVRSKGINNFTKKLEKSPKLQKTLEKKIKEKLC